PAGDYALVKQTKGGSAMGITVVQSGLLANGTTALAGYINIGGLACGANPAGKYSGQGQIMAYTDYDCHTTAESTGVAGDPTSNAGISDEDPNTFVGIGGVTAANAAGLTFVNEIQLPFANIVSVALRNKLQSAEGLTSGSELLADVPSLSRAQVRAIY